MVGVNVERRLHRTLERIEADQGIVEVGAGIEVGAEGLQFFANLEGIARRSAFLQHALLETGCTGRGRRIGRIPAVYHQREGHHWGGMPLRKLYLQSIAERGFLQGRKVERHGVARSGLF